MLLFLSLGTPQAGQDISPGEDVLNVQCLEGDSGQQPSTSGGWSAARSECYNQQVVFIIISSKHFVSEGFPISNVLASLVILM